MRGSDQSCVIILICDILLANLQGLCYKREGCWKAYSHSAAVLPWVSWHFLQSSVGMLIRVTVLESLQGALPQGQPSSGVPSVHTSASQPLQPILPCAVSARLTWHVHCWQLLHSYEGGLPDVLPLTEKLICQGRPCCCPLPCSLLLDPPAEALLETCRKTHELKAFYLGIACKLTGTYFQHCISFHGSPITCDFSEMYLHTVLCTDV